MRLIAERTEAAKEALAQPWGRSAPLEMANGLCGPDCPGYTQDPPAGHLWPGEPADE